MMNRAMSHRGLIASVLGAMTFICASPRALFAQRVTGPFAGLFGGGTGGTQSQSLDFRAGIGTAYDTQQTLNEEEFDPFSTPTRKTGMTSGGTATLSYGRRGDRVHFGSSGSTTLRTARAQAPAQSRSPFENVVATGYDLDALIDARVRRNLVLDASGGASYAPFFQLAPLIATADAQDASPVAVDYEVLSRQNRTLTASAGATSQFTRRSSVGGSLSWRSTRFPELSDGDLQAWAARGTLVHRLARSWSLRFGAGREEINYFLQFQSPIINDVITATADYGSEVPLSHRISFSVSAKAVLLRQGDERKSRLDGDAQIARGFGRTWSTAFGYSRSTEFVAGIAEPLFSDAVTLSLNGLIATRAQVSSRISAARGQAGFGERRPFMAYTGMSKLTVGITRRLGVYAQHTYYHYELPTGVTAFELQSQLSRTRVSAGISLWIPLATETRVPLDPR
jgi:hypothetical protein